MNTTTMKDFCDATCPAKNFWEMPLSCDAPCDKPMNHNGLHECPHGHEPYSME